MTDLKTSDCTERRLKRLLRKFHRLQTARIALNGEIRKTKEEILFAEKMKDASLNNIDYVFQQVFNANRLSRGESTQNIDVELNEWRIKEIDAQIVELEKQIAG